MVTRLLHSMTPQLSCATRSEHSIHRTLFANGCLVVTCRQNSALGLEERFVKYQTDEKRTFSGQMPQEPQWELYQSGSAMWTGGLPRCKPRPGIYKDPQGKQRSHNFGPDWRNRPHSIVVSETCRAHCAYGYTGRMTVFIYRPNQVLEATLQRAMLGQSHHDRHQAHMVPELRRRTLQDMDPERWVIVRRR